MARFRNRSNRATTQNPTLEPSSTTTYELTVMVNGCVSNPLSQTTIVVNDDPTLIPSASYTLEPDCSASALSLTANIGALSSAIATYERSGPNGFTSQVANPVIANATTVNNGSYILTITDVNGCSNSATVQVEDIQDVVAQPILSSTGPACEGEVVALSIGQYAGSSVNYTWTTPSGTTTNITGLNTNEIIISPLDAATHEGEYYVTISCLLYTSPSPRDQRGSRMPSSA